MDLRRWTCWRVLGNPSITQPFTQQSVYFIQFSIMLMIKSSGTSSPFLILSEITIPLSVFFEISFLSRFIVEMWTRPYLFANALACVALPDPGGPKMISLGGLFGLYALTYMIRLIAVLVSSGFEKFMSISCMKPWYDSLTPLMLSLYSVNDYSAALRKSSPYKIVP